MKIVAFSIPRLLLLSGVVLLGVRLVDAETVSFDDLTLTPDSYWNGPDPNGTDEPDPWGGALPVKVGSFTSGGVSFVNRHNLNYGSWTGFAYSNTTDTTTPGFLNQYSAYPGSGYGPGSDNYGVAFGYLDVLDPGDTDQLRQLPYFELPDDTFVQSAYVTNATYAALSMLAGDDFAKKFGGATGDDPDWFKLTAYGTDASGTLLQDTVEFYLADYRFTDNSADYVVDEWTSIDLSPLAGAKHVYFNLASTDVGDWGMNTPAYFAIDNLEFGVVPEPSTIAMLTGCGLALGGVWSLQRRRTLRRSKHDSVT